MTGSLQDIRHNAWIHVRRKIGDEYTYDDSLACDEIGQMTASEATVVLAMPVTEMVSRWAPEIEYDINDYHDAE